MKTSWSLKCRRRLAVVLLVVTLSAGGFGSATGAPSASTGERPEPGISARSYFTHQLIIKYRADAETPRFNAAQMNSLSKTVGETLTYKRAMSGQAHVLSLSERVSPAAVEAIAHKLESLPGVEYAEPDYLIRPTLIPNDPSYASQWHYYESFGVNLPTAWEITTGSAAVRVAVLDTGITDHPDLAGRWVGGYDFISDVPTANDGTGRDGDPHDPGDWVTANMCGPGEPAQNSSWHGTHVAGTIGAAGNNGLGVVGTNWVSPIVPVRVLGRCGGFTSDIVDGMRWAAGLTVSGVPANANPAKVLNLSLGGPGSCSTSFQSAINAINAVGAIIVIAAGNGNANAANHQPGNCNDVVTVGATNRSGNRAFYSNFGTVVEISAPGGETNTNSPGPAPQNGVLSTLNTGLTGPANASYAYYQGTSMAAPHVAGVVSLMASLNPGLNFAQSLQILQSTARAFPAGSTCTTSTCGSGIVDAGAALNAVINPPGSTPTATVGPSPTPTRTNTPGGKATRTPTAAWTGTPTTTATRTPTATATVSVTNSPVPTATPTGSASPTSILTYTPAGSNTPGGKTTRTPTLSPTATSAEAGPSPTPTVTGSATSTRTPTPTLTSSTTPGTSDLIFSDGFEGGSLGAWSSSVTDGGDLSVSSNAALVGTQGLQALIDDNNALVVIDDSPTAEARYRVRFYFDPNSILMATGDSHAIFAGSTGTVQHLQLEIRSPGTGYEVRALVMNDAKALIATNWIPLTDAPHMLELDWRAATAIGASDGGLTLWLDGVEQASLTGVDNDTRRIDQIRLGAVSGIDTGTRGVYFFDAFESRKSTYIGP